jgi:hypothetical protein
LRPIKTRRGAARQCEMRAPPAGRGAAAAQAACAAGARHPKTVPAGAGAQEGCLRALRARPGRDRAGQVLARAGGRW